MAKFIIAPRMRLHEWVAEEKGYFSAGGLDYEFHAALTRRLNLDANWYHYNAIAGQLPLVNRVDVGASTNPIRGFTFSVWGRNLQQDRHVEAIPQTLLGGEIRRSLTFKIVWEPHDPSAPPH